MSRLSSAPPDSTRRHTADRSGRKLKIGLAVKIWPVSAARNRLKLNRYFWPLYGVGLLGRRGRPIQRLRPVRAPGSQARFW